MVEDARLCPECGHPLSWGHRCGVADPGDARQEAADAGTTNSGDDRFAVVSSAGDSGREMCQCGHRLDQHRWPSQQERCLAQVYTSAPLGGGSTFQCACDQFVGITSTTATARPSPQEVALLAPYLTEIQELTAQVGLLLVRVRELTDGRESIRQAALTISAESDRMSAAYWRVCDEKAEVERRVREAVTYTQADEPGSSLRAAGYRVIASRPARPGWSAPSRPRDNVRYSSVARQLWEVTDAA